MAVNSPSAPGQRSRSSEHHLDFHPRGYPRVRHTEPRWGAANRAVEGVRGSVPRSSVGVGDAGERQQAFDALAEASVDGIIMLDDDSVIRYANPAVERILGYEPAELVGGSKMRTIPERLRKAHAEALQRYLETGEKHIDWTYVELPGQHRDGHEVSLAISLNEFVHDGEHYFVGTFRDISNRKAVERELERQNERLERFASMLAHELGNPLQVTQIYLDFLRDDEDGATVAEIADALERIDEIIEVLLMLARGNDEVGGRESVDLSDVVADAWANTVGQGTIDVVSSTRLRANRAHVQQLLENLFRNAVEHGRASDDSPDGATVERDRPVTVRVGPLDDGFYVEDTGAGIPEADREKVAQAGYTTDEGGARFEFTGVETAPDE